MRLLAIVTALAAFGAGGCSSDTALGDPVSARPEVAGEGSSLPPVGHGGPLDQREHPAAVRGSSSGMGGVSAEDASGTLAKPIDPRENTGFAPDAHADDAGGAPAAQVDGAPINADFEADTAGTERDRELNQRLRLSLADNQDLAAAVSRLRLVTVDGVVTLQGQVATAESKERLEQAVAEQEGVKKVQNHLAVGAQ